MSAALAIVALRSVGHFVRFWPVHRPSSASVPGQEAGERSRTARGVSSSKQVHRVGGCARPSSCGPQPHRSDTSQCNRVSLIQSRAPTTGAIRAQRSPVAGAFSRERFECGGASPWSYPRRRRLSSSTAPRSSFRHSSKPHVRASGNDAADAVPHTVQPVGLSAAVLRAIDRHRHIVRRADQYCDVALH
jgi:hypothetical protein